MAQRTAKKWLEQDSWNSGVRSSTDPLLKKHWQNWTKLSKTNISEFWNGPKVQSHWKWTEGIQQIEICLFKKKNPKSWVITVGVHGVLAWNCFQPLTQNHQLQRSTRVAASSENQGYWFRYRLRRILIWRDTVAWEGYWFGGKSQKKPMLLGTIKKSSHLDVNRMGKTKVTADLRRWSCLGLVINWQTS